MEENEKLKLVRERNRKIFEEIKKGVTPIQDTTPRTKEHIEQCKIVEAQRVLEDIFGEE